MGVAVLNTSMFLNFSLYTCTYIHFKGLHSLSVGLYSCIPLRNTLNKTLVYILLRTAAI